MERTVRRKVRSACDKVCCETTIEAIVWAVRHELFRPEAQSRRDERTTT